MSNVTPIDQQKAPTENDIHNAVRNDYPDKSFTLGERVFPVKDLSYDDYLEFMSLAKPIVELVVSGISTNLKEGVDITQASEDVSVDDLFELGFDASSIDWDKVLDIAKKDLPRLAWLCCRQSDPKISIAEVKELGRRPQALLEVVLLQVKHNKLVQEFTEFFPRLGRIVGEMAPEMAKLAT